MSIRIALDNGPPEFYTNLDALSGRVILSLNRPEQIGAVVVKLEGESRTALGIPTTDPRYNNYPGAHHQNLRHNRRNHPQPGSPGNIIHEDHKVLYKFQQVFPPPDSPQPADPGPVWLQPGQHSFLFRFKIPMNNACGDPRTMSQMGGLAGAGGFADGPGIFGLGGIRVMDGSRQLMYSHVSKTLPPTFAGLPRQAQIDYYIKVTIQRPGLLKENWRYQLGFRFLPLEPPRPQPTGQEAYARRPFTFRPRSPSSASSHESGKKKGGFFSSSNSSKLSLKGGGGFAPSNPFHTPQPSPMTPSGGGEGISSGSGPGQPLQRGVPPSVEMSARLPYPSILTVGQPLPLRILGRKLVASQEQVFLTSLQVELVGTTTVRCQELTNMESTRWVIVSRPNLTLTVAEAEAPVGSEITVPASLWTHSPLPSGGGQAGLTPTFATCNLSRTFRLEVKLGLSWGTRETLPRDVQPQAIFLPLIFSSVEVYSGVTLPEAKKPAVAEGMAATGSGSSAGSSSAPNLPPRGPTMPANSTGQFQTRPQAQTRPQPQQHQPPPPPPPTQQPGLGQVPMGPADDFDAPPPSYEEAMNSKT